MSVQFGRWNFDGISPLRDFFERANTVLAPYGPNGADFYNQDGVGVLYRAFHTTKESHGETQPHVCKSGAVITWDGRLDNRTEIMHWLGASLSTHPADVLMVAAAYEKWGIRCLTKLIGDWALSLWNPNERSLILAKDPVGTRHLYYSVDKNQITWSSILDPLLLFAERSFALDEEYIAGWHSFFPAAHLTPYAGIESVPPSCFVRLELGRRRITQYWDFDPHKTIRYRRDAEYEEHFRNVFAQAVERRLRSDSPILAELSGGMDSSSIVCMADAIVAQGASEIPRIDTLSYYNDSEPNWNERPYFTKVEEKRGRAGCHIDVSTEDSFSFEFGSDLLAATPACRGGRLSAAGWQFATYVASQASRVVLSGIGGDQVTGGVPTPTPELMDLLARARFKELARALNAWALNKRKPWFHLFFQAVRGFLPSALAGVPRQMRPAAWLHPRFVKSHWRPLTGYPTRVKLFGPLPSFQENVSSLESLRRQLSCTALSPTPLCEKRYPYLDRDFLEFMYSIPREQLVRPGQRRSLMRRALVGIVPDELLHRRRKAFVARSSMAALASGCARWTEMSQNMMSAALGVIDPMRFCEAVQKGRRGESIPVVVMHRTLAFEFWLRAIGDQGILLPIPSKIVRGSSGVGEKKVLTEPFAR
jgi:asparagine synthase (glutamine-hydrolysing)